MVSLEDALFDNNKYFFPEGAAKVREQRVQEQQPWLEVSALRDEEHGTPGLQPVPNEQKYALHDDKGLHGDYIGPAFISSQPVPAPALQAASFQDLAHTNNALAAVHDEERPTSSQTEAWSQPATIPQPPHWSEPVTTPEQHQHQQQWSEPVTTLEQHQHQQQWSQPVTTPEQHQHQQQWSQPLVVAEQQHHNYDNSIAEHSQRHYLQPGVIDQSQWSQSSVVIPPSTTAVSTVYPEQTYWARPVDPYGNLAPYNAGQQHSYSSLEVSSRYSDGYASSWTHGTNGQPTLVGSPDIPLIKENIESTTPWKPSVQRMDKRRLWWIAGGILGLLIVIGAIVGGVFGSRAASKSTDSGVDGGQTPSNDTVALPKTIRQNSKLAVTGYRGSNGNYTLRLFYQDPDNKIRFMDKSSIGGKWTDPVTLDTLDYEPMPNGSITVGSYLGHDPQLLEFFYLDTTNTIRGVKFNFWNDREPLKGEASNINAQPLQVAENSSISSYFPFIVSQDPSGSIRWSKMVGKTSNESTWYWENDTSLLAAGSPRTDMVLLPISQSYIDDAGFVYRNSNGNLTTVIKDYDFRANATDAYSWTKGTLAAPIPADSSIGTFVVGRPYSSEDINTYILYQDNDGAIQVVWQDGEDDDGWQGPSTYDALGNAEMGTDIECLTQGAWDAVSVQVSREQDMNRCFFQEKGTRRLKEVWFDGDNWKDQGFVPLD